MASYSDDFAGTGALGANWVHVEGSGLSRDSGKLRTTAAWSVAKYVGGTLATYNQSVQATIASSGWNDSEQTHQIMVRMHNGATTSADRDWVAAITHTQGNPTVVPIRGCYTYIGGSYSPIENHDHNGVIVTGDVMSLRTEGIYMATYKNGSILSGFPTFVRLPIIDSNHLSVGVSLSAANSTEANNYIRLDDWSAADVTTPTFAPADDFERGDNPDLGARWMPVLSYQPFNLEFGCVKPEVASSMSCEFWTSWAPKNDQWSETTVKAAQTSVNNGIGPAVRCGYASSGSMSFYYLWAAWNKFEIWKIVAGGASAVATGNTTNCVAGDVIRLEVEGTTLRAKRNGTTLVTATDSDIASGFWGMIGYATSDTNQARIDAWAGGEDFAAAAGAYHFHNYAQMMGA